MGTKAVATVGGVSAVGFFAASLVVPKMMDSPPPWLASVLMAVAAACILVPFVWWMLGRKGGSGDEGAQQISHGPHSPNLSGTFHGPVTIAPPAPAEKQPRKSPHGGYDIDKLNAGLGRVVEKLAAAPRRPMDVHPYAVLAAAGAPIPQPDLPLNGLLVRLYATLLPRNPKAQFIDRVDREVANRVKLNQMGVWGHIGKRPIQLIPLGVWDRGEFDHLKGTFTVVDGYPDPSPTIYTDLYFNKAEVDQIWPEKTP